jgi:hypothetical protein
MRMGDRMESRLAGIALLVAVLRGQRAMSLALPIHGWAAGPAGSLVLTKLAHTLSAHEQRKCVSGPTLTNEEVYQ